MQKLLFYIFFVSALCVGAVSCSNETDDIFPETATQRLNKSVAEYDKLLQSSDSGWVMEYFPGYPTSLGGFAYTAKFKDGNVAMRSQVTLIMSGSGHVWQAGQEITSMYDVKAEQGVILSFDTYSVQFHYWSDPMDGPSGSTGYLGDYEFEFLRVSQDQDTIFLRGKKYGNIMRMLRFDGDGREYIDKVNDMTSCTENPNRRYLTINGTQYPFQITSSGIFQVASQDSLRWLGQGRIIFREDGFGFYEPLDIEGTKLENFKYDFSNGNLTTADGVAQITMPSVRDQFLNGRYDWAFVANTDAHKYNSEMFDSLFSTTANIYDPARPSVITFSRMFASISNKGYSYGDLHAGEFAVYFQMYPYYLFYMPFDVELSEDNTILTLKNQNKQTENGQLINLYRFGRALEAASPYKLEFNEGAYKHTVKVTSTVNPDMWFTMVLSPDLSYNTRQSI